MPEIGADRGRGRRSGQSACAFRIDLSDQGDRFPATLGRPLGERPCLRATNETDMPGSSVSSTSRIFSATDQRGGAAPT
jgi:hypothetical protein